MPKVQPRTHRTTLRKRKRRNIKQPALPMTSIVIAIGIGIFACFFIQAINTLISQHMQKSQMQSGSYTLSGEPTISATFINNVLTYYHSPAQGKGQALYDDGVKYHIDPAFALAFFMHESSLGTRGVATVTHSLGNIRASDGYDSYDGYRKYASWEDGFDDWYKLISQQYIASWGLTSVDQIIPVYAPASDNNDEQAYIQSVEYMVDRWRSGQVDVSS